MNNTVKQVTVRHSPAISKLSTEPYETIEYIAVGNSKEIADSAMRKCLENPGFMARGQRLLFFSRSANKMNRRISRVV